MASTEALLKDPCSFGLPQIFTTAQLAPMIISPKKEGPQRKPGSQSAAVLCHQESAPFPKAPAPAPAPSPAAPPAPAPAPVPGPLEAGHALMQV